MCTVTIIPTEHGIRMACNRDESPLRAAALPPRVLTFGARRALLPTDPLSGGTWIAATDAGLLFTLLNAYPAPRDPQAPTPRISRGTIIPGLIDADSLAEAWARTQNLRAADYAAFRLVLADCRNVADLVCAGGACHHHAPRAITAPILFTSSGLGDALVDAPRRALFEEFFAAGQDWRARQDAYHRHSWPERRHLSVCMRRPEARTVSLTIVEMATDDVRMEYFADAPDQPTAPFSVRMGPRERYTSRGVQ